MTAPASSAHDQPLGMFTVDARLIVRTWDGWMAAVTGIAPEDALDRPLTAVLPGLEDGGLLDVLKGVLERGTVEMLSSALHRSLIDCPPRTPSAHFTQMQQRVTAGPVRQDGRITGVLVTIEDMTARMDRDRARAESSGSLAGALGEPDWNARQKEVRELAQQGQGLVHSLVATLRDQHRNFSVLSSALELIAITDLDVVEPMIACLSSDDADLRVQAALILGERRDGRAILPLIDTLADADTNVRFHAIESLGQLRATQAIDALVAIAEARDFFLAFPAIQALARIGDVNIAPRLVPLLTEDLLGAAVVEALGELGDDVVVEPLVALLGEPNAPVEAIADALTVLHDRYERRYAAGGKIAHVVRRAASPSATRQLLDAVDRVSSDRLRGLARVLGWLDGQAVQQALARMLSEATVRAEVVEALVRHGAGVVDLLIEQLLAEDLETQQAATVALGRIGDRRATPALIAALREPGLEVPAAGALARIGDPAAFEALIAMAGHPDSAIRQATIAALNSIGHPDMPRRVLALLRDPDPLVRESAVKVAGYFGYETCLDAVLDCCADPEEPVRRAAVEQLPMFDDRRALARLGRALADERPSVRAAAAAAFAHAEAADAIGPLQRALDDDDAWVRYFALRALGSFQEPSVAPAVHERLEHDGAGQVRLAAIDVLGRLQPPGIMATLAPLALSDDADTARAAIRALRHVQDAGAHGTLDQLSRAADAWRRAEATSALGQRGGAQALSTLQWVAAADESADVAEAAIAGLVTMAARDDHGGEATRALVELLAEPSRRESAIAALARLPVRRVADVASGLSHASPQVRRSTVEALSRMRHTEATRWIETALDDPAPAVRATAASELRHLGSSHAMRKLVLLARVDPDDRVRRAATMASGAREAE